MTKKLRVLLADDHEVVRRGLRDVLTAAGDIDVVGEAEDGHAAVKLAGQVHPDVVVLDVSMPDLDGARAAERIRDRCPGTRIVALTVYDDRAHLARMLEAGASGYVVKQSAAQELVRAIRVVADGRTWVDPILAGQVLSRGSSTLAEPALDSPEILSDREEQVLRGIAWGYGNTEIGTHLGISARTVETYKARIAQKLRLHGRPDFVRYALRQGWLSPD